MRAGVELRHQVPLRGPQPGLGVPHHGKGHVQELHAPSGAASAVGAVRPVDAAGVWGQGMCRAFMPCFRREAHQYLGRAFGVEVKGICTLVACCSAASAFCQRLRLPETSSVCITFCSCPLCVVVEALHRVCKYISFFFFPRETLLSSVVFSSSRRKRNHSFAGSGDPGDVVATIRATGTVAHQIAR